MEACRSSGLSVGQWCQENGMQYLDIFPGKGRFWDLKEVQDATFARCQL